MEPNLNSNILLHYVSKGCEKINQRINEKDIVLVIGNTGSGKSTLVNYLIGHKISFSRRNGIIVADIDYKSVKNEYAQIGHQAVSQTFFPEAFVDKTTQIYYCDCPGFFDTRGLEECTAVSVNLGTAIRNSKTIKAIIVTINFNDLISAKGKCFKELYNILDRLVNMNECAESIIFVITRCDPQFTNQDFINYIKELINSNEQFFREKYENFKSLIKSLTKNDQNEINKKEKLNKILNLILENEQNVLIANLNNNHLRDKITKFVNSNSNGISKKSFNLNRHDDYCQMFYEIFNEIVYEALVNLRIAVVNPAEISLIQNKIDKLIAQLDSSKELIEKISHSEDLSDDDLNLLNEYKSSLNQEELTLNKINDESNEINKSIQEALNEKKTLDSEKPYIVRSYNYTDQRSKIFGKLAKSKKFFYYSNYGTPILKVEKTCENGEFYKELSVFKNGFYSIKYKSETGKDGIAKLDIYIMEKYKPENQTRINYLEKEILKNLDRRKILNEKFKKESLAAIEELKSKIENFSQKDNEEIKKSKIEEEKIKIQEYKRLIKINEIEIKHYEEMLKVGTNYIQDQIENIKKIEFLIESLKINSIMSNEFLLNYNEYKNSLNSEKKKKSPEKSKNSMINYNLKNNKDLNTLLQEKNELIAKLTKVKEIISEKERESEAIKQQLNIVDKEIERINNQNRNIKSEILNRNPKIKPPLSKKPNIKTESKNNASDSEDRISNKILPSLPAPLEPISLNTSSVSIINTEQNKNKSFMVNTSKLVSSNDSEDRLPNENLPSLPPPPPAPLEPIFLNTSSVSIINTEQNKNSLLNEIINFGGNISKLKKVNASNSATNKSKSLISSIQDHLKDMRSQIKDSSSEDTDDGNWL